METKEIIRGIDSALEKILAGEDALRKASHYAVFPAGKRLRPLLALTVAADLGCDPKSFVTAACALELLHTSSLVHDDLPCMDNDDERRGRPTVHRAFSESTALLAGDFLIAEAFRPIFLQENLSSDQKAYLCKELSDAYRSLCEGQQLDLYRHESLELVIETHRLKTGGLFKACCAFGAIFAGVDKKIVEFCSRVGEEFGILFQILDDLDDQMHLVSPEHAEEIVGRFETLLDSSPVSCPLSLTKSLMFSVIAPLRP